MNKLRSFLYLLARILGDIQAVRQSARKGSFTPLAKRIGRRIAGRAAGRGIGNLFPADALMVKLRETMWAEVKPDCYAGERCNQIRHLWNGYADGDKEGGEIGETLEHAAAVFPPGTKVVVSEPVCPICDEVPGRSVAPETFADEEGEEVTEFRWRCACDFDWREFTLNRFS